MSETPCKYCKLVKCTCNVINQDPKNKNKNDPKNDPKNKNDYKTFLDNNILQNNKYFGNAPSDK